MKLSRETQQVCTQDLACFHAGLCPVFSSLLLSSIFVQRTEIHAGICGAGAPCRTSGCSLPHSPHSCCCRETTKCGNCSFSPVESASGPAGSTPRALRGQKQVFTPSYRISRIPSPNPLRRPARLHVNPTRKFYLQEAQIVSAGCLVKYPKLNLGKSTGFYRGSDTLRNKIGTEESSPTSVGL